MKSMILSNTLAIMTLVVTASGSSAQLVDDDAAYDAYQVEDSLEARVWLDRGVEPVVERGDEVRVYYRTSDDAFAAIFRIDTDGRISLLYPQHPDVDPFVAGGRDYRLIFPDSPRWRVREDPGVGYFFMIASRVPLDFSALGFDADRGWDLRGVGETVYEDPYVAIDDYVAALLPTWETTPYALDFLEYSVGSEHDYPRFLCYDCHDFRSYASWNPYTTLCSSYQVVIWDDPYFYPRFRYAGTRVVFARPLYPRPRYTLTTRVIGSPVRPIVRTRPAPPRRTAIYKEDPRVRSSGAPTRAPTAVPGASRAAPGASRIAPGGSRVGPGARRAAPGASGARPAPSRPASRGPRAVPSAGPRGGGATRPSGRLGRPGGLPARGRPEATRPAEPSGRPTLQRRAPSGRRPGAASPARRRPPPSAGSAPRSGRAGPSGPPTRPRARPAPRSGASGPPPRAGSRPPPPSARPSARPPRSGGRPSAGPPRSGGRPGSRARPPRSGGPGGSAAPGRPGGSPGRGAGPARGGRPGGSAGPARSGGRLGLGSGARPARSSGRSGGPPRGSKRPPRRPGG